MSAPFNPAGACQRATSAVEPYTMSENPRAWTVIALNALRIRAHRIRLGLQKCVEECVARQAAG